MRGQVLQNEILAKYTSWRVGGPAEKMFLPADKQDLIDFFQSRDQEEDVFWLGLGSNLLIGDDGIKGTVINTRGRLKIMQLVDSCLVYVEAGVPCAHVARFCSELNLKGAEFLVGIPGTMGGALKMNAGAFGGETWNIIKQVEMIDVEGRVFKKQADEFDVAYRSVKGLDGAWFLSAQLQLTHGDASRSHEDMKLLLEQRSLTQPTNKPTCGSVFKNPPGDYAARLIESLGLKGYCIGGACISAKHANFIENTGSATAKDIVVLIEYIQQQVKQHYDVELQTEVCIAGEFQDA